MAFTGNGSRRGSEHLGCATLESSLSSFSPACKEGRVRAGPQGTDGNKDWHLAL